MKKIETVIVFFYLRCENRKFFIQPFVEVVAINFYIYQYLLIFC